MNYQRSFTYIFEDEKWINKCLIGIAVLIVPILNFAWIGYALQIIQNPNRLPEWDHLDDLWMQGFKYILATWIYSIPVFFLLGFPALFSLLPILFANGQQDGPVFLWILVGLAFLFSLSLIFLYGLFLSFFTPAILINYSKEGNFSALFACKQFFALIRKQFSAYALVWIISQAVSLVSSLAASFAGMFVGWFPFVGGLLSLGLVLFAGIYSQLVTFHLYSQLTKE